MFNTWIGNKIGRRPLLYIGTLGTLLGAALQAGSVKLGMFMFTRLLNGFAVGILTASVPPYVAELTKPRFRGLLMSIELVLAATGLMSAFWFVCICIYLPLQQADSFLIFVGSPTRKLPPSCRPQAYVKLIKTICVCSFRKETGPLGWRMPLAIQAFLVLISLACLMFSPESPRYLVEIGRMEEARAVLARLYGQEYADQAIREIQEAVELEESVAVRKWSDCFQNNKQCFRYRTLCAIGVNFFQQATGINVRSVASAVLANVH